MESEDREYAILYSEELDAWILSTDLTPDKNGSYKGVVLFVGDNRSVDKQQDELLDLILKNDKNKIYYEEILRLLSE
jgi:hypothetical protein